MKVAMGFVSIIKKKRKKKYANYKNSQSWAKFRHMNKITHYFHLVKKMQDELEDI